jgi:putative restriction endonuclease
VRYWWINHGQAVHHDIAGGYLWLPEQKRRRVRDLYCPPAHGAAPGDAILSCAGGRIGHVGRVAGRGLAERGAGGEGWWLPVDWTRLRRPVAAGAWTATAPGAGLAAIPEALFHDILRESGAADWSAPPPEAPDPDGAAARADRLAASRLAYGAALDASVREQLIRARRGQGLFRFRVFRIESACRLTGIDNPHLLIASHIRPWRLCETTHERLDGANGLLLTPHVDRLFDRGLIGFSAAGDVLRSPRLPADDLRRLGLEEACRRNVGAFSPQQQAYLAWHRAEVFDRGAA